MKRFVADYTAADCIAVLGFVGDATGGRGDAFAAEPGLVARLEAAFRQEFGVGVSLTRRTVTQAQCTALRVLAGISAGAAPGLTLRAPGQDPDGTPRARRGDPMLATISNVGGRAVDLIEIGQDGQARSLATGQPSRDAALFRPIRVAPDSSPGPLLLVAIAAPQSLGAGSLPSSADSLFRSLVERASSGGDAPGLALRVVSVQP
jgi:hypothetical protein